MIRNLSRTVRFAAPRMARGYAEGAPAADKLRLSFALPRDSLYSGKDVTQVNLPTTAGTIGILANHVPTIEELKPGVIEVIDGSDSKQYFVAGGFATVSEGSVLDVNAVEGFPVEDFSASEVKSLLADAQKNAASSDEATSSQAKIEVEVLEALSAVAK